MELRGFSCGTEGFFSVELRDFFGLKRCGPEVELMC